MMQKPELDMPDATLQGPLAKASRGSGVVRRRAVRLGVAEPTAGRNLARAPIQIVDMGGPVIPSVQVQLIFWGTDWKLATSPSAQEVTSAVNEILTGPFMLALNQYRSIGKGTLIGTIQVTSSDPADTFRWQSVEGFLSSLLGDGSVAGPAPSNQTLYVVIMPAGKQNEDSSLWGEHSFLDGPKAAGSAQAARIRYAWATNHGTLDSITLIFSHELAEACTDPEGDAFQIVPSNPHQWNEISDSACGCEGDNTRINGVSVQTYWSVKDHACLAPAS